MAEFVIADTGEVLITGEWTPSYGFDDVEARLIGLSRSLDDLAPVLFEAKELARQSTEAHFDSQTDPKGEPWQELSESWLYDKRKVNSAHPETILQLTEEGKRAATSEEAYFITEGEIWFNPNVMPSYMALHQRGTTSDVQRPASPLNVEKAGELLSGVGPGRNLPKREFIGFDEIDIIALQEMFATWFAANVLEFFPEENFAGGGGGGRTSTGFNVLGEFPIVGFTKRGQPLLRTPAGIRFGRKM